MEGGFRDEKIAMLGISGVDSVFPAVAFGWVEPATSSLMEGLD
jgi:hypothetical protein